MTRVALLGGTGFLGRAIVARLLQGGNVQLRIVSRSAAAAAARAAVQPNVEVHEANVVTGGVAALRAALDGCDKVVNLVGLLHESPGKGGSFVEAHTGLALALSEALDRRRCVQLSALGADVTSSSAYARTKAASESALDGLAVVLRPSIVYGPGDAFFNRFASMARLSPFLPAVGGGATLYQPTHVDDVARAVARALDDDVPMTAAAADGEQGPYQLGGADTRSFAELMRMVLRVTGRARGVLPIPYPVAQLQGAAFEALHRALPAVPPIITRDQVELLRRDNVVAPGSPGYKELGIDARGCDDGDISYIKVL